MTGTYSAEAVARVRAARAALRTVEDAQIRAARQAEFQMLAELEPRRTGPFRDTKP